METFRKNILTIYGKEGEDWLAKLPSWIQQFEELWNLRQLKPVSNLSYHYVLSGFQGDCPIILKLSPSPISLNQEAKALELFETYGAVSVLAYQDQALLMQRAVPGTPLKTVSNTNQIHIACQVIEKLRQAPLSRNTYFPHIKDWLSALDQAWNLPLEHLEKARLLKDQLLAKQPEPEILLHGDLHRDNILQHEDSWVVIDPKGVIGYPINEIWACVENPAYDLHYLAEYFNYSFEDVVGWYYVHLILAACWQVEDQMTPNLFLTIAESVKPMLK